ncbi:hypothetical protein DICVIV_06470 [Dictyocaulus viviparus]|uniref:Uncharacterized protein n=1 Tax=Dictyocaulus viviparus TaxID=29172 RepID=A0A0D8XUK0_DICVI|nr:hypothetical protein DICVIV_06470 [Dictyocaulus viviparus]
MTRYILHHFAPQSWYCDFKHHKNKYILIKYYTGTNATKRIADEFDSVFLRAEVPSEQRAVIHSEMLKGRTKHSTSHSDVRDNIEKKLLGDEYLMRHLMHMYYYDFIEFGFI